MPERPDALALLAAARETLAGELLPGCTPAQKLPLLMVAKALAIASRELEAGPDGPGGRELSALAALADAAPPSGSTPAARREQVRQRLRAGPLDVAADAALRAGLLAATRARLAVSNPRLLAALDELYGHRAGPEATE